MNTADWVNVLARINTHDAMNIDHLLCGYDERYDPSGQPLFPVALPPTWHEVAFKEADAVTVAAVVSRGTDNKAGIALHLAALAMEKNVQIVVFTDDDYAGLERFGFRVERVDLPSGEGHSGTFAQLKAFWNVEVFI